MNKASCVSNCISQLKEMLTYKSGFLEGLRSWRGAFQTPKRNPELQVSHSIPTSFVYLITVNSVPPKCDTQLVTCLWVIQQFKGLSAQSLYGLFGSKGFMETELHCLKSYEILTGVAMKIAVFWHVTPCSLVKIYCSFKHRLRQ